MEQEKEDILDNDTKNPLQKKLWTIRLLLIGGGLIALTFLIATFWETLGFSNNETVWLALSMMISFGINLAGFILGFVERKRNPKRALFGVFGNLIFILLFIFVVAYSLSTMQEIQS